MFVFGTIEDTPSIIRTGCNSCHVDCSLITAHSCYTRMHVCILIFVGKRVTAYHFTYGQPFINCKICKHIEEYYALIENKFYNFSAAEPKAHYCDSKVMFLSGRPPLLTFYIFDFSSETVERNSTKLDRKTRYQHLLPLLCFSGRLERQDGQQGIWLAEIFLTSPLKTAEQNSIKLDSKQCLNIPYQVCFFFRTDRKSKMAALASDWLRHFRLLWNRWTEFNETWQEAISQRPVYQVCIFRADRKKQYGHPTSDWLRHFRLLFWKC